MKKKYLSTFLILALFSSQSYFGGNNVLANNKENKADENNKNILTENKADKDKNLSEEITWDKDDFFTTNNGKTLGGRVNNTIMSGFTAKGKEKLKKNHHVVIPEGIEIIDEVAFTRTVQTPDDEYIESVTFPSTLKKIGYGAFHSQKIKGTLEIPEGVTEISPGAFISNQIEKVILPSTLVKGDFDGISNRAFQDNKIREVVLKENFKNVKFQIDGNDRNYMSAGPFDNQNLGEITASVGSEFKMPFVINQIGESDIQSLGGFKINNVPTQIENCDFLTKKDGKYIITKAGKYPAQFLFYDSHGRTFRKDYGFTRPFASINFTYNIVQNNTVTFMDDDKVIKKVEVENGKNIDSDNITEEKGQMPKNPAKQGYTFKGWNTKKDGTGQDFTKTTKVTEDIIVYAIYDENTYKVNYNFKSADGKNLPEEVTKQKPEEKNKYKKGEKITPVDPAQKEISVDGGIWTFQGYDTKEQTVEDKDLTFTGTWKFTSIKPLSNLDEAPQLEVADKEIMVGETLDLKTLIIKATDKEEGDLKDKVQIVDKGGFDNSKIGTYKITYKVTDSKGASVTKKATVKVKQPQMTLNEAPNLQVKDAEITVGETLNLKDLIISATDKEDGDLKDKVEINKGEFNNNKVGTYKITYKVTDNKGATATKQATVKVKQPQMTLNEAPNLQVKDAEITVGETLNLKDLIISAKDKEDGDLKDKVEINKGEFNNNKVGTYKITYKVTDSKGAVATKQATVKVKDKVKPAPKKPKPKPQAPKPKQEKGVINDQKTLPKTSPQTPKSNKTLGTILAVGLITLAGLTRRKRK